MPTARVGAVSSTGVGIVPSAGIGAGSAAAVRGSTGVIWRSFWSVLGSFSGSFGAVLGPFPAVLGAVFRTFEAVLGASGSALLALDDLDGLFTAAARPPETAPLRSAGAASGEAGALFSAGFSRGARVG